MRPKREMPGGGSFKQLKANLRPPRSVKVVDCGEGDLTCGYEQSTNAEISAQLASLKRGGNTSSGDPSSSDLKAMSTRVANAERRATHAQNLLLTKEEQMMAQIDRYKAAEEKWAARVAEYERREKQSLEKFKNERQGGKESILAMQNEIE